MNNIYIFILCFFIFIFIVLLFKFCNIDKNNIFCFFITVLIILFVSNIEASINAALDGLRLCFKAIIPTIFSFSLICNLLICYDGISTYSKLIGPLICKPLKLPSNCSFPLVGSILCGYPLGAKFSSNLYENGDIEKKRLYKAYKYSIKYRTYIFNRVCWCFITWRSKIRLLFTYK